MLASRGRVCPGHDRSEMALMVWERRVQTPRVSHQQFLQSGSQVLVPERYCLCMFVCISTSSTNHTRSGEKCWADHMYNNTLQREVLQTGHADATAIISRLHTSGVFVHENVETFSSMQTEWTRVTLIHGGHQYPCNLQAVRYREHMSCESHTQYYERESGAQVTIKQCHLLQNGRS